MIPVEQRQRAVFDEQGDCLQHGDCLSACVASIFELPLEEVPFFVESESWHQDYQDWLCARGFVLRHYRISVAGDDPKRLTGSPGEIYWIATVYSPRGRARCSTCGGAGAAASQWVDGEYVTYGEPRPCMRCQASGLVPALHAVVMFGYELVWDPHPERAMGHLGYVGGEQFGVVDPAALVLREGPA